MQPDHQLRSLYRRKSAFLFPIGCTHLSHLTSQRFIFGLTCHAKYNGSSCNIRFSI